MYTIPSLAKYDFWIKNNLNVLFIGKHGVGKTETVKAKFTEHFGNNWLYFSAATMDPWVDFIGVPKEVTDSSTGMHYLELVRPKAMQDDSVEAIFIDEYNRGHSKTKNAVMELMQFKSINGKKFKNLKIIWAAINPDDDDAYDVEKMDAAQQDRFQVQINFPYTVNPEYFIGKYGDAGETAATWWEKQEEDVKNMISPRRLDYALNMFTVGGDLSDVLPFGTNIEELVTQLSNGSYVEKLKALYVAKNIDETTLAFKNENFYFGTEKFILKNPEYLAYFVPKLPREKLCNLFLNNYNVRRYFDTNEDYRNYQAIFDPIIVDDSLEQKSILSLLNRWKSRTASIDSISDIEFINMVSDNRRNVELLSKIEKQLGIIDKFNNILSNDIVLDETYYTKMLGTACELMARVTDDAKPMVLGVIKSIKNTLTKNKYTDFDKVFSKDLPGLRKIKNNSAFETLTKTLTSEGILV